MKRADLQRAVTLSGQYRMLQSALRSFDAGAQIVQLVMSTGPVQRALTEGESPYVAGGTVTTTDIQFPPQTMQSIKALLQAKLADLDRTLKQLGVEE